MVRTSLHLIIPDLLQAEAYTRHLFELGKLEPKIAERRVQACLKRQERLFDPDPLQLAAVIDSGSAPGAISFRSPERVRWRTGARTLAN